MFVRTAKATHIFIGLSGVKIRRLRCNLVANLFSVSANPYWDNTHYEGHYQ